MSFWVCCCGWWDRCRSRSRGVSAEPARCGGGSVWAGSFGSCAGCCRVQMAWVPVFGQLRIVRDLAGVTSGGTSPEVYEKRDAARLVSCRKESRPAAAEVALTHLLGSRLAFR